MDYTTALPDSGTMLTDINDQAFTEIGNWGTAIVGILLVLFILKSLTK